MRENILTLQVKTDVQLGIMDIGKRVAFNVKTRVFEIVESPTHGYTVLAYNTPNIATVDFTPLNREITNPERKIRTVDDLYDFFDAISELAEKYEESVKVEGEFVENTEDELVVDQTTEGE